MAFYWLISERDADLVAGRRQVRWVIILLLFIGFIERAWFATGTVAYDTMYLIHMLLMVVQLVVALMMLMSMVPQDILAFLRLSLTDEIETGPTPQVAAPDTDAQDVARIRGALEEDRIYREMGLAVRDLAEHLQIPEYRLRNLIHEGLGFRNFNALLHHYRIAEVCEALADPQQNRTPVLTLALSAGYQSITPFNRAFREVKGMTPTQYRANEQAQTGAES